MEGSLLRRAGGRRLGRMRAVDALTLGAVGLVVLLVSLPRLRDLALRENEADAAWLTARLGELCVESDARLVEELVVGSPSLVRQVDDVEYLDGGRLLRRHGYLFELLTGPDPSAPAQGQERSPRVVRAWPWEAGRTGRGALLWTATSGLVGHPNADGRWSGDHAPSPTDASGEGWRHVRRH